MDKNSITGLVLITIILALFWWMNKPSAEEIEAKKRRLDSIHQVELLQAKEAALQGTQNSKTVTAEEISKKVLADSLQNQSAGLLAPYLKGTQELLTLENNLIKVTFSNKGGRIYSVEIKDYKTFDGQPLILFNGDDNRFGFVFTYNTRIFNTNDLFFNIKGKTDHSVDFEIAGTEDQSLTFSYNLNDNTYMVDHEIASNNLGSLFATARGALDIEWTQEMPAQEKGRDSERQYSGIYYKYFEDEVDWLSTAKSDEEDLRTKLKWIAFKDQFFSSVFIANDALASGFVSTEVGDDTTPYIRLNKAETSVPYDFSRNDKVDFRFFFGPNHFYTLRKHKDLDLEKLIPLGWGIFGWINRFAVIPVFNFLEGFVSSYGIIILLLTLLIKLVLFPLTYKSYMSTAKMRALKPQIDEINERIPKDKAMERQQATMGLYRKAGVNPMGGCLPMLLQMPILIAMFRFFPASIELRQESFLWATDLSTYDSILTLPWKIPFYGDHVSLFCLLMSITNVVYTHMNQEMTQSSQQMPGMKGMMYMMPVMFLFFFNNYASGLSYYYFVSTLITIGQTILIRNFVDEKALLAKLKAHQKKPTKKSSFQARLENMAKQQQQLKKGGQSRKK
jgi:YidC/Oxa1 family membrane protein insertase